MNSYGSATGPCANCNTPLLGPHCHACGQPAKGMVRHFSSVVGDLLGTLLALDSRVARTLAPLFSHPGFLTTEYFAGRRVRYVSPVRLFVFLCLTAFFVARLSADWRDIDFNKAVRVEGMAAATRVEEVERLRDEALAGLAEAKEGAGIPGVVEGLEAAAREVRRDARARIAELQGDDVPAEPVSDSNDCPIGLGDACWDPRREPLQIEGFPQSFNDWLADWTARAHDNLRVIRGDPNRFKEALFGALPSTLLLLLPVFSLMLWFLYLFQRRLYMEHLIVGLHGHAFLCLSLLLVVLVADIRKWLGDYAPVDFLCGWAIALMLLWMPAYLLLMQKRVYGQGWGATLLKFCVLGISYSVSLGLGATLTALSSLASL